MPKKEDPGVDIDVSVIKDLMKKYRYTQDQVAKNGKTSRQTVSRAICTKRALPHNLQKIAKGLHIEPEALLPQSMAKRAKLIAPELVPPYDCEIVEYLSDYLQAANGITYCIAQLRSTEIASNLMRGKYYNVIKGFDGDRAAIATRIRRHAEVCIQLKDSKYLAKHRLMYSFDGQVAYWILDDWIPGSSLHDRLADGDGPDLCQVGDIGSQILYGLGELHTAGIAMRELAPERIYVSDDFRRVTLTDFEMAKILGDGVPSVSGEWKTINPYRAPEHIPDSDEARVATPGIKGDIYSWSAVICKMLTGNPQCEASALQSAMSDEKIVDRLLRCRSKIAKRRPNSVEEVLEDWLPWAEPQGKA